MHWNVEFRKGMLSVLQADDQLMHLQWKDRGTGTVEVSLAKSDELFKTDQIKSRLWFKVPLTGWPDYLPRRCGVQGGACLHHWQGLRPQVQDQQQEDVLLDAGLYVVSWHLGHSHILLRRSQRLTRMRSCARRYALHRRKAKFLLRFEKFVERRPQPPTYSWICCR